MPSPPDVNDRAFYAALQNGNLPVAQPTLFSRKRHQSTSQALLVQRAAAQAISASG
jgi:hypothetical protein